MINIDFTTKPQEIISDYITDKHGNKCLYDENGDFHSHGGFPAYINKYNTQEWYKHGLLHREGDLPAIINTYEGYKEWWINGKFIKSKNI